MLRSQSDGNRAQVVEASINNDGRAKTFNDDRTGGHITIDNDGGGSRRNDQCRRRDGGIRNPVAFKAIKVCRGGRRRARKGRRRRKWRI